MLLNYNLQINKYIYMLHVCICMIAMYTYECNKLYQNIQKNMCEIKMIICAIWEKSGGFNEGICGLNVSHIFFHMTLYFIIQIFLHQTNTATIVYEDPNLHV